ncbi:phage head closure protein [Anaeromicropila populeti]|uniref:Phage head-tail adaptor, putative, SPP1 family n=1 Tax=Anaeromicropila populeti TaxID=37658 RepID=A0A1I6LRH1_9FIRM|nr:phage head closure protein [Anaeromicropila populeti]SFS05989.1 phage head-tail adaptor, putative, SPP1 family [Anaeromicropila populeti]
MKIGQWRNRILIQKSVPEKDMEGNHVLSWRDFYSCAAYVNHLSGAEYWAAAQANAQQELCFVIRFCREVKELDTQHYRIIFGGKPYNITLVDLVQFQNKVMKLRASLEKR